MACNICEIGYNFSLFWLYIVPYPLRPKTCAGRFKTNLDKYILSKLQDLILTHFQVWWSLSISNSTLLLFLLLLLTQLLLLLSLLTGVQICNVQTPWVHPGEACSAVSANWCTPAGVQQKWFGLPVVLPEVFVVSECSSTGHIWGKKLGLLRNGILHLHHLRLLHNDCLNLLHPWLLALGGVLCIITSGNLPLKAVGRPHVLASHMIMGGCWTIRSVSRQRSPLN